VSKHENFRSPFLHYVNPSGYVTKGLEKNSIFLLIDFKNFKIFQKTHCRHTYGLKSNHYQLLILAQLQIFIFVYRTLFFFFMRQKTKNHQNQGPNDKKMDCLDQSPSRLPRWVNEFFDRVFCTIVQKTRAKNSHAWVPFSKMRDTPTQKVLM
jgi:hypothetical protein